MPYSPKGHIEVPFPAHLTLGALRGVVEGTAGVALLRTDEQSVEAQTDATMRSWGEKIRFTVQATAQENSMIEHGSINVLGAAAPNRDYRNAVDIILTWAQTSLLSMFLTGEGKGASWAYAGTVVGGRNTRIQVGRAVVFAPGSTGLFLAVGEKTQHFAAGDLMSVEAGGPGTTSVGGGFIGGGFGLIGAIEGMLVASLLNSLTTRTSVNTLIHISSKPRHDQEFLIHTAAVTPAEVSLNMAGLRAAIQHSHAVEVGSAGRPNVFSSSLVDQLTEVAELHARGVLNDDEFSRAKQRVLEASPD